MYDISMYIYIYTYNPTDLYFDELTFHLKRIPGFHPSLSIVIYGIGSIFLLMLGVSTGLHVIRMHPIYTVSI